MSYVVPQSTGGSITVTPAALQLARRTGRRLG